METLITGNTGYLSEDMLCRIFENDKIVVVGKDNVLGSSNKNIISFPVTVFDKEFNNIFLTYNFDRVIYISEYLTLHGSPQGEMEALRHLLGLCRQVKTEQILYLTSTDACSDVKNGKTVALNALEEMCRYFMEENRLPLKIIRIPYLMSETRNEGYFSRMFSTMAVNGRIEIWEDRNQIANFIYADDLTELLYRVFDDWDRTCEVLNVFGCDSSTFGDLGDKIKKLSPRTEVVYTERMPLYQLDLGDNIIRRRYGWFYKTDVIQSLDGIYKRYLESQEPPLSLAKKIWNRLLSAKKSYVLLELIAGWFLVEGLNYFLGNSVQFKFIDVRLLFVVIIGTVYGINAGFAAAFMECVSLVLAYSRNGMNWQNLFYNSSNWVPFLLYFTVGAICGYIKIKNEDAIHFVKNENQLIQEKNEFIKKLYQRAVENKSEYKKQLIGSRDSFGKIFEVVRYLDTVIPQQILAESIPVMEDILQNQSIGIYSIYSRHSAFGRLEVSSKSMSKVLPKSIELKKFSVAIEALENGGIWYNQELLEDYPMYIAGVKNQSGILMLIMLYQADYSQMGLYYANLFRIICGLIESSFLKAWRYQQAIREQMYIKDTVIARTEYFVEQFHTRSQMSEMGIANYVLVRIDTEGRTLQEIDAALRMKVRESDLLGMADDGQIYLLLTQMDSSNVSIVMNRLDSWKIHGTIVTPTEAAMLEKSWKIQEGKEQETV